MSNKLHRALALLAALLVIAVAPVALADAPKAGLAELVAAVERAGGEVGVAVVEVASGRVLSAHEKDKPLNPASNMKLFTVWAALRMLGPQHRYLTGLYGTNDEGRVAELVLRSDGDPSLERDDLWEMLGELRRAGVREIGDILVDQSRFDASYVPPAFEQQPDEWAAFRAPVAAVSLAANTVVFEVRPRRPGEAASVSALPASFVELSGTVRTSESKTAEAIGVSLKPRGGHKLEAQLSGTVPAGSGVVKIWRRVDDPTLLAGYALRDIMKEIGIAVSGEVRAGGEGKRPLLVAHQSAALAQLLFALGKDSNNFYAETVFKSLSAGDKPASFERSSELVASQLREAGIDPTRFEIKNGSGLFDANRVTAAGVAQLLARAHADPRVGPELMSQLSIGGVDGTLRHRFKSYAKKRVIRAKSGTLAAASTLSGYVLGRRVLAFSVLINGARGKTVQLRDDIDRFVGSLADEQ